MRLKNRIRHSRPFSRFMPFKYLARTTITFKNLVVRVLSLRAVISLSISSQDITRRVVNINFDDKRNGAWRGGINTQSLLACTRPRAETRTSLSIFSHSTVYRADSIHL